MYKLYNSYMSSREVRAAVKDLCRKALEGRLMMESYQGRWPKEANQDPFLACVDTDLLEAIVHVPITLAGRLNEREWRRSAEYATLALDLLLLDVDAPSAELVAVRNEYGDYAVEDLAVFDRIISERFPR